MKPITQSILRRIIPLSLCAILSSPVAAQSAYDQGKPFGFCNRSSRTSTSSSYAYETTGGGCYSYPEAATSNKVIVLKSNGKDMASAITNAIKNYSIIILDGSEGDFVISKTMSISNISNKTLLGINNARLCTQWHVTQEMKDALNAAGVPGMSTSSGTGGKLSNGSSVSEEAEFHTRQILINLTGDTKESFRSMGIFSLNTCSNIIIRNIKFQGPGSIDVSGSDLIGLLGSKHIWVDHCEFRDGSDGNFDITQKSDFVTVSWCTFSYTENSYMHQNTNLVGSSDSETTGYLNITFAFNNWGEGCRARMPMARVGLIHMLNNYYTCTDNATSCINPRKNSEFLIEGNYFADGVTRIFSQSDSKAWTWTKTNHITAQWVAAPSSSGTVKVPYTYSLMTTADVPQEVGTHAGATLWGNSSEETAIPSLPADCQPAERYYTLDGRCSSVRPHGLSIIGNRKIMSPAY